jgi:hypothetical protein
MINKEKLWLIPISDLESGRDFVSDQDFKSMEILSNWVLEYLCTPHPSLGRAGPVCPFTRQSIEKGKFWIATISNAQFESDEIVELIDGYRDLFLELPSKDLMDKTIILALPGLNGETCGPKVDDLQKKLKPHFVNQGLMIGQFYSSCMESGLWNEQFHPLQSPIPLLAIRHMVPSDFPFLVGTRGNSQMLIDYFSRFAPNLPKNIRMQISKLLS